MKNPLRYQLSEFDCGPSSLLNAVSFLFEREEILPDLIRGIMLYSLDTYGPEGMQGEHGTSRPAMRFLSSWLDSYGKTGRMPVSSTYLSGEDIYIGTGSPVNEALSRGGAVIVRLYFDVPHYVLLTGEKDGCLFMFDPYYRSDPFSQTDILVTLEHPFTYNRVVPFSYFNKEADEIYALGVKKDREAVLVFNSAVNEGTQAAPHF